MRCAALVAALLLAPGAFAAAPWMTLAEGPVPGFAEYALAHPRPLAGELPGGICYELSRGPVPLGWIHRAFAWEGKLYYSRCAEAESAASTNGPLEAELLWDLEYTFVDSGRVKFGRIVLPQLAFGAKPAPRPPLAAYLAYRSDVLYAVVYDFAKAKIVAEALFEAGIEGRDPAVELPEPRWEPDGKAVVFPRKALDQAPLRLTLGS